MLEWNISVLSVWEDKRVRKKKNVTYWIAVAHVTGWNSDAHNILTLHPCGRSRKKKNISSVKVRRRSKKNGITKKKKGSPQKLILAC